MYKVFFQDRTVFFGDDFSRAFVRNKGLFYRYINNRELHELIDAFFLLKEIQNLYIFHEDMLEVVEEFKSCFTLLEAGGGLVFNEMGEFLTIRRQIGLQFEAAGLGCANVPVEPAGHLRFLCLGRPLHPWRTLRSERIERQL